MNLVEQTINATLLICVDRPYFYSLRYLGDDHPHVAITLQLHCYSIYDIQGKYEEALRMSIIVRKLEDDHPHVAITYVNIVLVYGCKLNKYKEALKTSSLLCHVIIDYIYNK